jgi:hypothetical protein
LLPIAWQAMQFFDLARSAWAKAFEDAALANTNNNIRDRFIDFSV